MRPRHVLVLVLVGAAGFVAADVVTAAPTSTSGPKSSSLEPSFRLQALVTRVIDGDTIVARAGNRSEHVRLLGIDTPESGDCFAAQATARTRGLSLGKRVKLLGDSTQAKRDRYGRLLAYVVLPNGSDLDRILVAGGFAKVYVYNNHAFARAGDYLRVEAAARGRRVGLWGVCGTTTGTTTTTSTATTTTATTTTGTRCDPSYPTVCIRPPPPDLDCKDVPYTDFKVVPPDPHRFDGDHDGLGCESY